MISVATLLFFRLMPIFVVSPIASFRRSPVLLRLVLCGVLAILMAGPISSSATFEATAVNPALVIQEFAIGAVLAFGFHSAVAAMQTFGQLIDFQMGFAAGSVFDPSSEQVASLTGELFVVLLLVAFFTLNFHHQVLTGLFELNRILPPGTPLSLKADWIYVFGSFFTIGFIVAAPVVITLWLFDMGISFVARSLPQAQIYFVALPMKVMVGILSLAWLSSNLVEPSHRLFNAALQSWNAFVEA